MNTATRVFISATTGDLGSVRQLVKEALLSMDCHPVEQTNFAPDYRTVREVLKERIASTQAVVHIVGCRFGAEPDPANLPAAAARRSYTQLEYDLARELDKKVFVFICADDFPYDSHGLPTLAIATPIGGRSKRSRSDAIRRLIKWKVSWKQFARVWLETPTRSLPKPPAF